VPFVVTLYSEYTGAMTFLEFFCVLRPVIKVNTGKRREIVVLRMVGKRRLSWLQAMVRCSWCSWVEWRGVCWGGVGVCLRESARETDQERERERESIYTRFFSLSLSHPHPLSRSLSNEYGVEVF
jgi:hypothetical protein